MRNKVRKGKVLYKNPTLFTCHFLGKSNKAWVMSFFVLMSESKTGDTGKYGISIKPTAGEKSLFEMEVIVIIINSTEKIFYFIKNAFCTICIYIVIFIYLLIKIK